MLKKRNTSVHIYNEDEVDEMIVLIRDSFIPAFAALKDTLEKKPKKEGEPEIEEVPSYFADTVLNSMFLSYLEYRKENGKEVKGKAIGYCIDKLESLSNSPAEQVAIIKQTIQNGWTDFFPLKGKKEKVSGSNVSSWLEREKIQSTGDWYDANNNGLVNGYNHTCICYSYYIYLLGKHKISRSIKRRIG